MVKMPHWPVPRETRDISLGLSRVNELLSRLHNPHKKLPPIVHIAGTNGKGSTLAYLRAILEAAGYKVHRYTSPHLVRFNERIMLAGQEIEDGFLQEITEECRIAAGDLQTTFFEGTTAAAFLAFSKVDADIVLLETGMGGRLDATNVIDQPLLSIITPISYDHVEYLGATLAQIAHEKAGIIKSSAPCVISWQMQEVSDVLKSRCMELGSEYFAWGEHWNFINTQEGFTFVDEEEFTFPHPILPGIHQIVNAATAIAAIQYLHGYNITYTHIVQGLANAEWPARLQQIVRGVIYEMLPNTAELWIDGAHNASGAEMLSASLSVLPEPNRLLYVINGRTKGRDIGGFLQYFYGKTELLCSVNVKEEPLSEKSEVIYDAAIKIGFRAMVCDSIKDAVQICIADANGRKCRIIACGSLYLAGDILAANAFKL